jgi:hypothetical protein
MISNVRSGGERQTHRVLWAEMGNIISMEQVRGRMMVLRGLRVMLSEDLAELYGTPTKALVQAVKRNRRRFPSDFMFALTRVEWSRLRSQIVTLKADATSPTAVSRRGRHTKHPPLAFTEHGVAMLSSVLKSQRAIDVNIEIVRAFVHFRRWLIENRELARRLDALEKKYDGQFNVMLAAIDDLMSPTEERKPIGFTSPEPPASPASPRRAGSTSRRSRH